MAKLVAKTYGEALFELAMEKQDPEELLQEAQGVLNILEENPDFELVSIRERLCEDLQEHVMEEGCLQLLPGVHQSDGFFIAKFKRKKHG